MRSFLSWLGGKSRLAKTIVPLIPEHHTYCEVFAGAAWILFKKEPSDVEVINDIHEELTTLYRVVQNHLEEFVRHFKWALVARDEFKRQLEANPETLTDIQRAARFYYLIRTGYGSRITSPTFSSSKSRPSNLNLLRIEEDLSAAHLRLSRVTIENRPYHKLITALDSPDTFFYVDPPYWDCEDYYGKGVFGKDDFQRLRELLGNAKGKFMMSINDVPEIRMLFDGFNIQEVTTEYVVNKASNKPVSELLIMNY